MSFPINLLPTEEILAELQRRKLSESREIRTKIHGHKQAILELEAKLEALTKYSVRA